MDTASSEPPILNILGDKIALGPLRRDLLPVYLRWANDFEVTRTLGLGWRPTTLEAEEAWYESAAKGDSGLHFTIYERETLRPIGNTGLHDINLFHRTAELGLMIGEKERWGRGYGTEAARLMLDYGFQGQGLHNIMARVLACNTRSLHALQKAGFREFGRLRAGFRLGGRVYDLVYLDCLATEFESPLLGPLLDRLVGSDLKNPDDRS
ncbi:MAG TPA: GNAT family protein [Chthonomonadaceae bacterium]|nr:GNAT family protein [Chthonomonadaceae bacterium]